MEHKTAILARRSVYGITEKIGLGKSALIDLVKFALTNTPSAFDSRSARAVLLFGNKHTQLWNIVLDTLRKIVPEDNFASTQRKIQSFKKGYGTILYFIDDDVTAKMSNQNPLYADQFPVWAEQANGMLQLNCWNLLAAERIGASLQHYNPLIDQGVKEAFALPPSWRLVAQMPFGSIVIAPDAKQPDDADKRLLVKE